VVYVRGGDVALSEAWDAERGKQSSEEYTVVGVLSDGAELNQAVLDLKELGIGGEDLTVVLKRTNPDQPEPFPEGTRYIIVPDNARGLAIPISFAAIFFLSGLLFAFTTPSIGALLFVFFTALAAILVTGAFVPVGVDPILIEMEVPPEDSELWNEEFEKGKILVFASTAERRFLRFMWEALRKQGADFYVVERRLEPQPVSGAVLHWAGEEASEEARVAADPQEAQS
jgi:hypothetical protein